MPPNMSFTSTCKALFHGCLQPRRLRGGMFERHLPRAMKGCSESNRNCQILSGQTSGTCEKRERFPSRVPPGHSLRQARAAARSAARPLLVTRMKDLKLEDEEEDEEELRFIQGSL